MRADYKQDFLVHGLDQDCEFLFEPGLEAFLLCAILDVQCTFETLPQKPRLLSIEHAQYSFVA